MKPLPLNAKGNGVGVDFSNLHIVKDRTSLSLPGLMLSSQWLLVVSLDTANGCMDQAISGGMERPGASSQRAKEATLRFFDGVIGRGFFSSLVVEIDYAARLINLHDPRSYEYTGNGMSLPLEMDSNYIYVRTQVKAAGRPPVTVRLIVDTGSAGTLTLNKQFAAAHGLLPPAEQLAAANECGMGGLAEGPSYEGRLEGLQLGDFTLSNPATFFRHTPVGEGYDGLLGNLVLRNFKVIFDFSRGRMILEPLRQVGGNR